jgi:hypothetical protein
MDGVMKESSARFEEGEMLPLGWPGQLVVRVAEGHKKRSLPSLPARRARSTTQARLVVAGHSEEGKQTLAEAIYRARYEERSS